MTNNFYCYSSRLHKFLDIFGFVWKENKIHEKTKKEYWVYEQTEYLGKALRLWIEVKTQMEDNSK